MSVKSFAIGFYRLIAFISVISMIYMSYITYIQNKQRIPFIMCEKKIEYKVRKKVVPQACEFVSLENLLGRVKTSFNLFELSVVMAISIFLYSILKMLQGVKAYIFGAIACFLIVLGWLGYSCIIYYQYKEMGYYAVLSK